SRVAAPGAVRLQVYVILSNLTADDVIYLDDITFTALDALGEPVRVTLLPFSNLDAAATRDALEDLVTEGKIRWYGWSTDDPERARLFAGGEHCAAVQQSLSVLGGSREVLAVCEEFDLASINRGPLVKGLLTGKFDHDSTFPDNDTRMRWDLRSGREAEQLEQFRQVRDVLCGGGRTPAQGALCWLWGLSGRTIPIPGFKTVAQVEENARAMEHGPLSAEEMAQIEEILGRA
ncbi:MAG: aldo/keto reductase, partial [Armatimonadetes bacterium]|nr:aldo/keto reductase [Armatimonadota bacterium]